MSVYIYIYTRTYAFTLQLHSATLPSSLTFVLLVRPLEVVVVEQLLDEVDVRQYHASAAVSREACIQNIHRFTRTYNRYRQSSMSDTDDDDIFASFVCARMRMCRSCAGCCWLLLL